MFTGAGADELFGGYDMYRNIEYSTNQGSTSPYSKHGDPGNLVWTSAWQPMTMMLSTSHSCSWTIGTKWSVVMPELWILDHWLPGALKPVIHFLAKPNHAIGIELAQQNSNWMLYQNR
jgi:asparagine synthetase B (glutamine-hydrolysing)